MSRVGNRAFKGCDVKSVEFIRRVRVFTGPEDEDGERPSIIKFDVDVTPEERESSYINGYGAKLHCPRIEDGDSKPVEVSYHNNTELGALSSLRTLAGELLCSECRYSGMTPAQVSIERAKFAEAEAERIKAFGLRAEAIQELEERGVNWQIQSTDDLGASG